MLHNSLDVGRLILHPGREFVHLDDRQVTLRRCNYLVCIKGLARLLQKDTLVNGAQSAQGQRICGHLHDDFFPWDSGGRRKLQRNLTQRSHSRRG